MQDVMKVRKNSRRRRMRKWRWRMRNLSPRGPNAGLVRAGGKGMAAALVDGRVEREGEVERVEREIGKGNGVRERERERKVGR